jgi:hypothetical protein
MHRRGWMAGAAISAAIALSVGLFATASSQNGPPDDRGRPPGVPASIQLTPDPLSIQCDGIDASTITVRVVDARGRPVPDGTAVYFDALYGFVDPVVTETTRGEATTQARLYAYAKNFPHRAKVDVTIGDLRASIGLDCAPPSPQCGPDASPPCPTPTPCNVPFSPPCPEPTPPIICEGGPTSPPCPIICDGGPVSPPCPLICDGGPWSPPCTTPAPTRTPSNTSVFFAMDADLTADGVQSSRPTSVPMGENFTVDVVLYGDVIPGYVAYQVSLDYDDELFDATGVPVSWQQQPVIDVSGGTPLGTLIWPSGKFCDPSPASDSVQDENDIDRGTIQMTCADSVFGEESSYRGVLLTLVFKCEQAGTGELSLRGVDDTFILESVSLSEFNVYNDGVAHGSVTCGDGAPAPAATPTSVPTATGAGLDPFELPADTPTSTPTSRRPVRL